MVCRQCHHQTTDISHEFCRTHAYCSREGQYLAALCNTCVELWERAQDIDNPEDAVPAFQLLKAWIEGFRRNAKTRPRGVDHFFDPHEREAYEDLFAVHANLRIITQLDSSHQQQTSQVRFLTDVVFKILLTDLINVFHLFFISPINSSTLNRCVDLSLIHI